MKCPACDVTLAMSDRQGIEIDYCPQCRGVWLDRGELDKIIERAGADLAPQQPPRAEPAPQRSHGHSQHGHSQHGYGDDHYRHKKKKSLLGELFDF